MAAVATAAPTVEAAYHTRRRPERETYGPRLAAVFSMLTGYEPMPWQLDAWDILGELLTDQECETLGAKPGTPAYRELRISAQRRAAKSAIAQAALTDTCTRKVWGQPTIPPKAIYTCQTGSDARKFFMRHIKPTLTGTAANASIKRRVEKVLTGMGQEEARFRNGASIYLGNNTSESMHGQEYDFYVIDEAMADRDNRRDQALAPGQLTMPWAQRIVTSAAGTAESLYWNEKQVSGRQAVEADTGIGVAYIEFALPQGASVYDPEAILASHPAVGYSIDLATLMFEIESEPDEMEARRAYGNIPTVRLRSSEIPSDKWAEANSPNVTAKGKGPHVWAVDVAEDRTRASIAVCNTDTMVAAVTDCGPGVDWIDARLADRTREAPGPVAYDQTGPAKNIGEAHNDWTGLSHGEMSKAFADLYDHVVAGTVKIQAHEALEAAMAAAEVRKSADSKKWSRSMSVADVSPLIAVTIAVSARPPWRVRSKPWIV